MQFFAWKSNVGWPIYRSCAVTISATRKWRWRRLYVVVADLGSWCTLSLCLHLILSFIILSLSFWFKFWTNMITPHVSAAWFLLEAHDMLCFHRYCSMYTDERKFRALFGCSPEACQDLWKITFGYQKAGTQPNHLLWALLQLKVYATEDVLSAMIGVDRKTFRKWVWPMIKSMRKAAPAVVSFICCCLLCVTVVALLKSSHFLLLADYFWQQAQQCYLSKHWNKDGQPFCWWNRLSCVWSGLLSNQQALVLPQVSLCWSPIRGGCLYPNWRYLLD